MDDTAQEPDRRRMGWRRQRAEHQSVQHRRGCRRLRAGVARRCEAAIAAAKAAFPAWSRSGHYGTSFHPDQGVAGNSGAQGRTRRAAEPRGRQDPARRHRRSRSRCGQIFDFFAGEALRLIGETVPSVRPGVGVEITREAVGVVGIITPWNFPIAIPTWKIAPALVYGNTIVFKPADLVPGSSWAIVDILHRAGLAQGRAQSGHGQGLGRRAGDAR